MLCSKSFITITPSPCCCPPRSLRLWHTAPQ